MFGGTADSRHLKRGKEPKQYTAVFVKGHNPKRLGGRIQFSVGFSLSSLVTLVYAQATVIIFPMVPCFVFALYYE